MEKTKLLLSRLEAKSTAVKALHTFWQGASAYLIVAVRVNHQSFHTVNLKVLLAGVIAAGLSALKSAVVKKVRG